MLFDRTGNVAAIIGSAIRHQVGKRDELLEIRRVKESGGINSSKNSTHFKPLYMLFSMVEYMLIVSAG